MKLEEFMSASVPQLSSLTEIPQVTWKHHLYKGGSAPRERFWKQASEKLGMSVEDLKAALKTRKNAIALKKQARREISHQIESNLVTEYASDNLLNNWRIEMSFDCETSLWYGEIISPEGKRLITGDDFESYEECWLWQYYAIYCEQYKPLVSALRLACGVV